MNDNNNKQWLHDAVEEYRQNSGNYSRLHPYIKEAIESYVQSRINDQPKTKIYVPFGEAGGQNFYVNVDEQLSKLDGTTLTRWLLEEACYDEFALETEEGKYPVRDDDDEAFTEMVTILADTTRHIKIRINPKREDVGNPYVKVFNEGVPEQGRTKVARLHFKDDGMEYHRDGFLDWELKGDDLKRIRTILLESNEYYPKFTNWQIAAFLWNYEYGFINSRGEIEKYFKGEFDEINKAHPSYVLHDQAMPQVWNYTPKVSRRPKRRYVELTEAGLVLENGEVIADGPLVEFVRKCQKLLDENDTLGFEELFYGRNFLEHQYDEEDYDFTCPELKDFSVDDHRIILGTAVMFEGRSCRLGRLLSHFDYDRDQ